MDLYDPCGSIYLMCLNTRKRRVKPTTFTCTSCALSWNPRLELRVKGLGHVPCALSWKACSLHRMTDPSWPQTPNPPPTSQPDPILHPLPRTLWFVLRLLIWCWNTAVQNSLQRNLITSRVSPKRGRSRLILIGEETHTRV
jgi:hypothetical protein